MVEVEIDGKKVEIEEGSMVMHAANKLGVYVPHFCYHKKLSIAANCRMCLVEVEKAPKPLPACATPVSDGMKIHTRSEKAVSAQKSVMEFLLINHPLDCPICDQGGECQLQDLAVGYGGSSSNYTEEKRVVFHKPMGPLVSAEEMTRCIHCTRCVRFGQEVAGVMELGMANRGEHAEIMTFVGRSIDSELSGNMIDICPVGALTSKPFRYSARTWELSRRKSVSPHDSLGSNLTVQIKGQQVMRVVPLENEAINECWISDRDRFAYEGLNSPDRLTTPMIKTDGQWVQADWATALNQAALLLATARVNHGSERIGALAGPTSTVEELYLLQKLARGMGSDNIDFRVRQADFSIDSAGQGAPWLGLSIAEISGLDHLLLIGSFLRKDHPVLSARIRRAVSHGLELSVLHASDEDLLMPVARKSIVAPSQWRGQLLQVLSVVNQAKGLANPAAFEQAMADLSVGEAARAIADSLLSGEQTAVLLGNAAIAHPQAGDLMRIGQAIATACEARFGVIGDSASSVGGYLAGATPRAVGAISASPVGSAGLNAAEQLRADLKAFLLLNLEPSLDCAGGAAAMKSLTAAETVVAITPFKSDDLMSVADVLLPAGPFTETGGSFVNAEARLQIFNGVVQAAGESRPGWKVLRVLANRLDLKGFEFDSVADVRLEALGSAGAQAAEGAFESSLSNSLVGDLTGDRDWQSEQTLERLGDVPVYFADSIVRRGEALQQTADAQAPQARLHPDTLSRLGLESGTQVVLEQAGGAATVELTADASLATDVVRVAGAHQSTVNLTEMFGPITLRAL